MQQRAGLRAGAWLQFVAVCYLPSQHMLLLTRPSTHRPPQLPALRWRPKLTSPYRRLFNLCHWYIGRVAVILAVANIYYVRGWGGRPCISGMHLR